MTQAAQDDIEKTSPLLLAQKIVDILHNVKEADRLLALKFAAQALQVDLPQPQGTPPTPKRTPTDQHYGAAVGHITQPKDIKSFTAEKAPKSDQQFAAVVAYFHQFEAAANDRRDTINANVMKEAARKAGRPQAGDWNMTLNNAKNSGFLDPVGKGEFKLNTVGENLVAITLPGDGTSDARPARKVRKKVVRRNIAGQKAASNRSAKQGG